MKLRSYFVALAALVALAARAEEKLVFAVDLIRHGDRTPLHEFPVVQYHWAEGLGELTPTGIHQEFELGTKFRELYVEQTHLLPSNYVTDTIYVRSTDVNRTLMSAESVLAGLYPPGTGPTLPGNGLPAAPLGLQPIPIHTIAKNADALLIPDADSAQFIKLMNRFVFGTRAWKAKEAAVKPKLAEWSRDTGIHITNLFHVRTIGDVLSIYQRYHVQLPAALEDESKTIIDTGRWVFAQEYRPQQVGHRTGATLLRTIAEYFERASAGNSPLRYVLFSAHDSTILSQMSNLGAPLPDVPPYASDLKFELFKTDDGQFRVEVKLNDAPVNVPAFGGDSCSLADFVAFAKRP